MGIQLCDIRGDARGLPGKKEEAQGKGEGTLVGEDSRNTDGRESKPAIKELSGG